MLSLLKITYCVGMVFEIIFSNIMNSFINEYFIETALPPELHLDQLKEVLRHTSDIINHLDSSLTEMGAPRLSSIIQRNNFSGIVSNVLTSSFDRHTEYKNNSDYQYPDLIGPVGLEIKCTVNSSKGGESHNGHSGWHMVASYEMIDYNLQWTCIKFANLGRDDWKYCGSKINDGGSQRTETYSTSPSGRSKLLGGICYLNKDIVQNWNRWRGIPVETKNQLSIL